MYSKGKVCDKALASKLALKKYFPLNLEFYDKKEQFYIIEKSIILQLQKF